jgi:hypothetical protein
VPALGSDGGWDPWMAAQKHGWRLRTMCGNHDTSRQFIASILEDLEFHCHIFGFFWQVWQVVPLLRGTGSQGLNVTDYVL